MPALHIVGEIVGAAGLRHKHAFSLAHWLDLLSLHPSSKLGFFCRWRVRFRDCGPEDATTNGSVSEWQVLQGASTGQTQVHTWSPISPMDDTITKSSRPSEEEHENQELLELDTLWSHPLNLHLAIADPMHGITSWPYLELQVWHLDEFHHDHLVGTSSIALPLAEHEFFLDAPVISSSNQDAHDADSSMDGRVFLRLSVLQQGFVERGIKSY